jgi:hypothetical protein
MPTVFELIATIKDIHSGTDTCRECGQAVPCRTYRRVDGFLAARFGDVEHPPLLAAGEHDKAVAGS